MKEYKYHVVYGIEGGTGTIIIKRKRKINTEYDFKDVGEYIAKELNFEKVIIINIFLLKK